MAKAYEDIALEIAQECLKAFPVIVLGSGASIPFGLPSMKNLANQLRESPPKEGQNDPVWNGFVTDLGEGVGLEDALQKHQMSTNLANHIIRCTWEYMCKADAKAFEKLIVKRDLPPLARLYCHLFRSTHNQLSVVTTNYDRLAEYAADYAADVCWNTGFTHGYLSRREGTGTLQFTLNGKPARTVDVWKVHGSLDWFIRDDDQVIGVTASKSIPKGFRPAIVTPGTEKYQKAYYEPFRSVLISSDEALAKAKSYLCVGYGFNDDHIQQKLTDRWRQGEAILVILTRNLTESAKRMLNGAEMSKFLVLEEASNGTLIRSNDNPDGKIIKDVNLWCLSDFLDWST